MLENEKVSKGLREILENLLTINPYFRWSATECLAHPMFDNIRDPNMENIPTEKIKLVIDQDDAFDYEEGRSNIFNTDSLISDIIQEVMEINEQRSQEQKLK